MDDTWTSLRVRRKTLERVKAECRALMMAHYVGGRQLPADQADGPTPDWLINDLLDVVERHRKRAKEAKQEGARKARAKKTAAERPADPPA